MKIIDGYIEMKKGNVLVINLKAFARKCASSVIAFIFSGLHAKIKNVSVPIDTRTSILTLMYHLANDMGI